MRAMSSYATAVKAARETRNLSIRQAAQRGGISNQAWSNLEIGVTTRLTDRMITAVAAALGWPDDWPERVAIDGTITAGGNGITDRDVVATLRAQLARLDARIAALEAGRQETG